jgi:predicted nuclease of predicted toxin-antitoxin system
MRILLDESLPWRLGRLLQGHEVTSVQRMGWSGVKNGALLRLASTDFQVLVTADQNLQFQQNLDSLPLAVFVLVARSTALVDLVPLVPALTSQLKRHVPRTLVRIGG